MAFVDAYPGGRVPALAPITWSADGWPVVQTVNGALGQPPTQAEHPGLGPHRAADDRRRHVRRPRRSGPSGSGTTTPTTPAGRPAAGCGCRPRPSPTTCTRPATPSPTASRDRRRPRRSSWTTRRCATATAPAWPCCATRRPGSASDATTAPPASSMTNGLTMDSSWNTTGTGTEAASAGGLRRPDLAAGQRRHPTRIRPPGPVLLQHRRQHVHQPRPGVHAQQRLAVLHGLPVRDLQLRHPGARRRRHRPPLRPHHPLKPNGGVDMRSQIETAAGGCLGSSSPA